MSFLDESDSGAEHKQSNRGFLSTLNLKLLYLLVLCRLKKWEVLWWSKPCPTMREILHLAMHFYTFSSTILLLYLFSHWISHHEKYHYVIVHAFSARTRSWHQYRVRVTIVKSGIMIAFKGAEYTNCDEVGTKLLQFALRARLAIRLTQICVSKRTRSVILR